MNELEVAEKIRDGEMPSPTRFGNASLFDLRLSGSGIADRPAHSETVYRAPEIWTSDEMVRRANGLPILMGHPAGGLITSDEYSGRNVGTVVLPYVSKGELRGIGRVCDDDAAAAMASGKFSTSPGVAFREGEATSVAGADGSLLIEQSPGLFDHIGIVSNDPETGVGGGVWDRGGPGAGIRNDAIAKETVMADDAETETTDAPDDSAKLDKLMASVGALVDMCTSLGARMDTMEKPKETVADDPDDAVTDAVKPRADAARFKPRDFTDAQARADAVAVAFGEQAPPPMSGETSRNYRNRLLSQWAKHSTPWKGVNLAALPDQVMQVAETQIYADALAASTTSASTPAGTLRPITRRSAGGHLMTEYVGSMDAWMCEFKIPKQYGRLNFNHPQRLT